MITYSLFLRGSLCSEGCKARILIIIFLKGAPEDEGESNPHNTCDSPYPYPTKFPHLRQISFVFKPLRPQEIGMQLTSSTCVNRLGSMEWKEIKPFFIDLLYLEPMPVVSRLEDVRLRGYPQDPQL